ncbi:restriction endonuclease subunit S, partial [Helicobacter ailurogastricus]|uniref:restriction endonuclease subunit S n=1 Tax=Helicobacter ailurogastricus TaxID=1578720 RepID=UPI0025558C56
LRQKIFMCPNPPPINPTPPPRRGGGGGVSLDSFKWREFSFSEVFIYERGRRYKRGDHTSGEIAYISSSALNNGVDGFVSPPSYMKIHQNKITLANSGSVGSCFYHPYPFVASDHCMVVWLKERELNRHLALFCTTILRHSVQHKYGFNREINKERLLEESFKLPTHEDGTIAYDLMESLIRALEKQQIERVMALWDRKLGAYEEVVGRINENVPQEF